MNFNPKFGPQILRRTPILFESGTIGQAEAVGGFTEITTKTCIGVSATATIAVSYLGVAELASAYGAGAAKMSIHATVKSRERIISQWAIKGAQRWGVRIANTGGGSGTVVRFFTTARYSLPVAVSSGGRYAHGLPKETKEYLLNVIRNIWTSKIITAYIEKL
jgi:hypothetical protein